MLFIIVDDKDKGYTLASLSPDKKRKIVLDAVFRKHLEQAWQSRSSEKLTGWKLAFVSTGTALPIDGSLDHLVNLQGFPDYNFKNMVTEELIQAAEQQLKKQQDEKMSEAAKRQQEVDDEEAQLQRISTEEVAKFSEAKSLGISLLPDILPQLNTSVECFAAPLARYLKKNFFIYGSAPCKWISDALPLDKRAPHLPSLFFDDIDIAVESEKMIVADSSEFHRGSSVKINKIKVPVKPGSSTDRFQVNITEFQNLKIESLARDADLNCVDAVLKVSYFIHSHCKL